MQARNSRNAQGIDVSHWQGKINWQQVRADGRAFAFIKASQGTGRVDPQFVANAKGAKAAGLLIGAYHFVDATSAAEARREANHFYNTMKTAGVEFDLPPVMDYENNPGKLNKAAINIVAVAFLNELEELCGRQPLIYTGNSFAHNFDASLGKYPIWIARYSTKVPTDVAAWSKWDIWQHSDTGKVPGIAGNVDLNEFNGTLDELRAWASGGEKKKEEPKLEQRDINKVSTWASENWAEAVANGYFDGSRPGAEMTREEMAVVVNRLRRNFLKLIAGNTVRIEEVEMKLQKIESGEDLQ
ncbi:glycoside hydrolase family 25 protein [Paenibacillus sp. FSL R5-0407]|uniref:glycoside hydrolase family 25 protein n=1 Tax=Paenibacillus sp. FSL R5-0407 TaxID=2975320 RepID=UPI0030F9D012